MNKIFWLFLLFCTLGLLNALAGTGVNAAAITGMVGVGTWNTQADFADVKVVQGTSTLYQSNFSSGMSEWKTLGGTWTTASDGTDNYLHQTGADTPALAFVGDPTWTNYTLTLKARKTGGAEGFLIAFGSPGDATTTYWNIGGFSNTLSLLQVPGVYDPGVAESVQTGVWYDIRVEVSGEDIRCYLNGTLVRDTARILDSSERTDRFNTLLNSPGYSLLNSAEQSWLNTLAGYNVYIGDAARETFVSMPSSGTFDALTASQQVAIIRQVNRNRLTWYMGSGFGSDWVSGQIIASMDAACILHNQNGLYDGNFQVNNNPGVATADASLGGPINFGSQYNERCALHELSHALGTGTFWKWYTPAANAYGILNGQWQGFYGNTELSELDGATEILSGDSQHYWPYGLNYDSEMSTVNAYKHVMMVRSLRRDMGIDTLNVEGSTAIASDSYVLVPRHAPGSALDVPGSNSANGTQLDIHAYTGADNQRFLLDLQSDGTYRIRTALAGNRCIDLLNWDTTNGNKLQLYDDNGLSPQRWYIIPMGDSWYRIAPKLNVYKAMDVVNAGTADGSLVDNWDYNDNLCQQWKLVPSSEAYTTTVPNGTYRLTPQHAPASALDVPNASATNGLLLDIHAFSGTDNQNFLFDLQSDGTYRIRTALAGNRCIDLPYGDTTNGNKLQLYDDNSLATQRWYLIPIGSGWYKIAPKNNIDKSIDVLGAGTADGTAVDDWDYLAGPNQLWKLSAPPSAVTTLSPTSAFAGSQSFPLTVSGTYFTASTTVLWNGTALTTTFVSATQITATVPASAVTTPGTITVTVSNSSATMPFTVVGKPTANAQSVAVNQGTAKGITLTGSDPHIPALALTYSLVTSPSHGTLTGLNPSTGAVTYTPTTGYIGADSFTFKVNNGTFDSAAATVSITVFGKPTANPQSVTANQGTPKTITLTGADPNTPALALTRLLVTNPSHGALSGLNPSTGTVTYSPTFGYIGADSFTFVVNNGHLNSVITTVSITVVGKPTANAQSVTPSVNTAKSITLTGTDPNTPALALTYSVVTSPSHGTLSGTAPNLTYTPTTGYSSTDRFTFKVNNGTLDSAGTTVSITVIGKPTANAQSVTTNQSTAKSLTLTGADSNTPAFSLFYTVATQPKHGTLSGTAPNLTYTPTTGYSGADSFTFITNNGHLDSTGATVSIKVVGKPTANGQSVVTNPNTAKSLTLTGTDPNTPALSLTYSVITSPSHGTLSGTAPHLTYTPTAGYFGTDSFTFKVNNGTLDSAVATVSITVIGKPTANAQSVTTSVNTAKSLTLTGADPNSPAFSLVYTVVTQPIHGTLSGTAPNLTYTPTVGYSGVDRLIFITNNGHLDSTGATVSLTVTKAK